jgi:hypothetical protein
MANFLKQFTPSPNMIKKPVESGTQLARGNSSQRSADPMDGEIRLNTDTSRLEVYDGAGYKTIALQGFATVSKTTVVTGDGSTTTFTSFFSTAPSDENSVIVVVGNVIQEPGQAYTISGTDITFTSPPPDTHRIYALVGFDSTSAA